MFVYHLSWSKNYYPKFKTTVMERFVHEAWHCTKEYMRITCFDQTEI